MPKNEHYLLIDNFDNKPEGYETVVRQLAGAVSDKQTKIEMDLEDEYAEDIEDRIELEEILAETKEQLAQQKKQLSQKDEQLSQKDAMITMLIKSMLSDGKTIESISKTLGLTENQISELLGR
jgi:chromosome segregation ATPase